MDSRARLLLALFALAALALLWLWLGPKTGLVGGPEPESALVAIEVVGEGVARVAAVEVEAGPEVRLHAVLVAKDRSGKPFYFTEAPALEIDGQRVPAEAVAPWAGKRPKLRWFTIEGAVPYRQVETATEVEPRFTSIFRPDWPDIWTLPGRVKPSSTSSFRWLYSEGQDTFGTLRYEVRVEFYDRPGDLLPSRRFTSPGVDAALADPATFPTLTLHLPPPLAPATRIFGLSQIEPAAGVSEEVATAVRQRVADLARQHIAFESLSVVAQTARSAGTPPAQLTWNTVTLEQGLPWGDGEGAVVPGDLLQAADRVTVLYRDLGTPGVLDPADLCLDFARGASVLTLDEVFDLEGDLALARLGDR